MEKNKKNNEGVITQQEVALYINILHITTATFIVRSNSEQGNIAAFAFPSGDHGRKPVHKHWRVHQASLDTRAQAQSAQVSRSHPLLSKVPL